ncbi:hypothetical protein JOF53_001225 [Crossiella equi]|uniref:ABC-2 family transporter protein n=1 Tax=Crossiella equi TaxID=130796 RepID=A0ABS5A6Y6_9PSEU|nr:hypothetical protein [Crossiella equi]MBP2472353.1 hypothetical protein [Crossiella equi]
MTRGLAYEWHRVRSLRSTWVLLLAGVAVVLAAGLLWGSKRDLGMMDAYAATMGLPVRVAVLLVAALGACAFTTDFQHGTIVATRLVLRRPAVVTAAKAAVLAALGLLGGLLFASSGLAVVLVAGGSPAGSTTDVVALFGNTVLLSMLAALAGLALGGLLRHTAVAVGLFAVWALLAENLLGGLLDVPISLLPLTGTASAFTVPEAATAPLVLAGLVLVGLLGSAATLARRVA